MKQSERRTQPLTSPLYPQILAVINASEEPLTSVGVYHKLRELGIIETSQNIRPKLLTLYRRGLIRGECSPRGKNQTKWVFSRIEGEKHAPDRQSIAEHH